MHTRNGIRIRGASVVKLPSPATLVHPHRRVHAQVVAHEVCHRKRVGAAGGVKKHAGIRPIEGDEIHSGPIGAEAHARVG